MTALGAIPIVFLIVGIAVWYADSSGQLDK